MPISDIFSAKTVRDFQAEDAKTRLAQELGAAQIQNQQIQAQSAQDEMASKRRTMAVSLLNGIANEPDPAKQAALYATLKPMAERYDTTLKLPDAFDPSLTTALMSSQVSPEKQFEAKLALQKYQLQQDATPVAVFDPTTGQQTFVPRSEVMTGGYQPPGAAPKVKPLPGAAIKDLEGKANAYEQMTRLTSGFQPAFSGNTVTGGLENLAGRLGGEKVGITDPGQTQWWQDYQSYVNQVRNDLFGSALTVPEKQEFLKAMVTPDMDPEQAAQNLARQQALAQNALARSGAVYSKSGYDADAVAEFVPQGLQRVDMTKPAPGGPKPGTEEDGYIFLGDNPADPAAWKKAR